MGSLPTYRPIAYYYLDDSGRWQYVSTTVRYSHLKGAALNLPLTYVCPVGTGSSTPTQRDANPQRWRVGYCKPGGPAHPVPSVLASKSSSGYFSDWTGKKPVTPNMKGY